MCVCVLYNYAPLQMLHAMCSHVVFLQYQSFIQTPETPRLGTARKLQFNHKLMLFTRIFKYVYCIAKVRNSRISSRKDLVLTFIE